MRYANKYGYKLQKSEGNAGYDICTPRNIDLPTGREMAVKTGLRIETPEGYWGLITPRSSCGREGMRLLNTAGVIDPSFRGDGDEIELYITNTSPNTFQRNAGDAIAQIIFLPVASFETEMVDDLKENDDRGGSGSTGPRGSAAEAEVSEAEVQGESE